MQAAAASLVLSNVREKLKRKGGGEGANAVEAFFSLLHPPSTPYFEPLCGGGLWRFLVEAPPL